MDKPVIINFIDFKKALDSALSNSMDNFESIWNTGKVIEVIRNLFNNSGSAVRINGQNGECFHVITRVRQGCILLCFYFTVDFQVFCVQLTMAVFSNNSNHIIDIKNEEQRADATSLNYTSAQEYLI